MKYLVCYKQWFKYIISIRRSYIFTLNHSRLPIEVRFSSIVAEYAATNWIAERFQTCQLHVEVAHNFFTSCNMLASHQQHLLASHNVTELHQEPVESKSNVSKCITRINLFIENQSEYKIWFWIDCWLVF